MAKNTPTSPKEDRFAYFRSRTERMMNFWPDDIKDKETIAEAAASFSPPKSLNAYILEYHLPEMLAVARGHIAKNKKTGPRLVK